MVTDKLIHFPKAVRGAFGDTTGAATEFLSDFLVVLVALGKAGLLCTKITIAQTNGLKVFGLRRDKVLVEKVVIVRSRTHCPV